MPTLMYRMLGRLEANNWILPAFVVFASYNIGHALMLIFEPADAAIRSPLNFWWYFIVSGTSTGYGDIFPVTTGGRIGGVFVIFAGLTAGVLLLSLLASIISGRRSRQMTGDAMLHRSNHLVIIGYKREQIKAIIKELRGDPAYTKLKIVVCFFPGQHTGDNPDPKDYDLIRWDDTAKTRSGLQFAQTILVSTGDDEKSAFEMIGVNGYLKEQGVSGVHVLMGLIDISRYETMKRTICRIDPHIELVLAEHAAAIANAIQNPGVGTVNHLLATNYGESASQYRLYIPLGVGSWSWADLAVYFIGQGISLHAVGASHEPHTDFRLHPDGFPITGGNSVIVVAPQRPKIDWHAIPATI